MKLKPGKSLSGITVFLAIHIAPVQAGSQQYLQPCDVTPDCSAAYQCVQGSCTFPSYISGEVEACKKKLTAAGVGANELVASHSRFCYHDASCPGMYAAIAKIAEAEPGKRSSFVDSKPTPATKEYSGNDEAEFEPAIAISPEQAAAVAAAIEAAQKTCSQCTAGGKRRCFSD